MTDITNKRPAKINDIQFIDRDGLLNHTFKAGMCFKIIETKKTNSSWDVKMQRLNMFQEEKKK